MQKLEARLGVSTGNAVAGVMGVLQPRFTVLGVVFISYISYISYIYLGDAVRAVHARARQKRERARARARARARERERERERVQR